MTEETGAAAPQAEQAQAPAASEQATPQTGVTQEADAGTEQAETQGQEQAEQQGDDDADKPKKRSTSDRYRRKISAQAGVIERLSSELDALKSKPTDDAPKVTDYAQGEWDPAFIADTAAHKAAQKISSKLDERDQRSKAEQINAAKSEAAEDFMERADGLRPQIPDFDDAFAKFAQSGGQFAPHVIEEIHASENGPMLAYHLAKNPSLAIELNSLSPRDVAREIGRLEAKVSLPQPKKQTQAPAPLAALKGGAAPATDLHKLAKSHDASAYIAARNAQEKARA